MTAKKQVEFLERVDKSLLRLDGLQIVVYCDRNRNGNQENGANEKYNFERLGKKLLNTIDGKYIKEKYNINEEEGIKFAEKLHEERIKWMETRTNW